MARSSSVSTDLATLLREVVAEILGDDPELRERAGAGHSGLPWDDLPRTWLRSAEPGVYLCHLLYPPGGRWLRDRWSATLLVTAFSRDVPEEVVDALLFRVAEVLSPQALKGHGLELHLGPFEREGVTPTGAGLRRADLRCQIRSSPD